MLLPLQGVLVVINLTPRAVPWAMCLLGFQPVKLSFVMPWALLFAFDSIKKLHCIDILCNAFSHHLGVAHGENHC